MTTEATAPAATATPGATGAPAGTAPNAAADAAALAAQAANPAADLSIGEAPAAEGTESTSTEGVVEYTPTGDAGLDLALEFVGKLGIGADHPAMKAADKGDFAMLEGLFAGMGDKAKGYQKYLALAKQSREAVTKTASEKTAKDKALVHEAVGGPKEWAAISAWAGKNAEPHEKEAVNQALKAGGLTAKVMAQWLATQYAKASGTTVQPAAAVKGNAAPTPTGTGPLTAAAYATAVQALRQKVGYNIDSHPEYQALRARRSAAMASGR